MTEQPAPDQPRHHDGEPTPHTPPEGGAATPDAAPPDGEDEPHGDDTHRLSPPVGTDDTTPDAFPAGGGQPPGGYPPAGGQPPGGYPPPPGGYPPPPPGGAGFPPPGGFPPPPPGTGGFAARYGLVRPTQGRYLAGVCAAVGRATNTDPVLWRVIFAVLAFVGGVGLLAYLVGWLLIPAEGDTASPVEALVGRGRSSMSGALTVILAILALLVLGGVFDHSLRPALIIVALAVGAVLLLTRNRPPWQPQHAVPTPGAPHAGPGTPPPAGTAYQTATGAGYQPPAGRGYQPPFAPHGPYAAPPPPPPVPPRPPREHSALGRLTLSLVLLVLGVLGVLDVAGRSIPAAAYPAAALAVVGLGLVVGAWLGRARWLIAIGAVLLLALAGTAAASRVHHEVNAQGSNVEWVPTSYDAVQDGYRHRLGNATLNLRRVDFTDRSRTIVVTNDLGNLEIILPPTVDVEVDATVNAGNATVFGDNWGGFGSHTATDDGPDGPGGGNLRLEVHTNLGNLEVHR